jgi:hypothetical protein
MKKSIFVTLMFCFCGATTAIAATPTEVVAAYETRRNDLGERLTPLMPSYIQAIAKNRSDKNQPIKLLAPDQSKA